MHVMPLVPYHDRHSRAERPYLQRHGAAREHSPDRWGNREPCDGLRTYILVVNEKGFDMNDTINFEPFDAPVLDERPWAVFSACREADPTIFFGATRDDERAAVAVCATCTVQEQCLGFALESRERFGVWGGTSERERKRLLRG